jgi:hypothetical protein
MSGWNSKRNQMMERRGAMYSPPASSPSTPSGKRSGWSDEARQKAAEARRAKSHHASVSHTGGGGYLKGGA